jgi:membrane associated rhomboid family serine protease
MSQVDDGYVPRVNPWHTATRWLLVLNVAVFVLDWFVIRRGVPLTTSGGEFIPTLDGDGHVVPTVFPLLASFGYFSFDRVFNLSEWWRFVGYQFCHASIEHIVVNMMGLLLAGPIVEERLGRVRYLMFYLLCGVAGPIAHLVFGLLGIMDVNIFTPLVGASASIYGILLAAAMIAPDEEVMLLIPPIDLKLRTVAIVMIGLSAAAVIWNWQNAGGHAAHIGGAVMGWVLAKRMLPRTESGT